MVDLLLVLVDIAVVVVVVVVVVVKIQLLVVAVAVAAAVGVENGEEPFKNPRNTASGSLKLQDSKEVSKRPLECLLYSVEDSKMFNNHIEFLKNAKSYGFNIYKTYKHSTSLEEIFEFIHLIEMFRLVEISDAQTFSGL